MKRQGFIYNKVMVQLVVASVDKASRIPHINVIPPTFEGDDGDNLWWVQSQQHHDVIYEIHAPFTKYTSCTCEWALWSNFCNHQIIILLICIDIISKNIIDYYDIILGFIMMVWNPCSLTNHICNLMMVHPTMRIATMLMKSTLLTLGVLRPHMKMVIVIMSMCPKVHPAPWIEL